MGILSEIGWSDIVGGGVTTQGSAEMTSHDGTAEAHVHGAAHEHLETTQTAAQATEHVNLDAVYHDTQHFDVKGDVYTQFEWGPTGGAAQPPADTGKSVFDQPHPDHHDQYTTHDTTHHPDPNPFHQENNPVHHEQNPVHHIPDYMTHPHGDPFSGPAHEHHHGPDLSQSHHDSHDSHSGSHSQGHAHGDPGHI